MRPPGGFNLGKESHVCLLKKSIYGLKQSPRHWNVRFDQHMKKLEYERSKFDSCVYKRKEDTPNQVYRMLYVDDILLASQDRLELDKLKEELKKEFQMKDLGDATRIIEIDKTRRLFLSQEAYIIKVLTKFDMISSKPVSTPLATHFKLYVKQSPQSKEELEYMERVSYANDV